MMKGRKKENMSLWYIVKRASTQVAKVSPKVFIWSNILFIIESILLSVSLISMQMLFDNVAELSLGKSSIKAVIATLLLLFVLKATKEIVGGVGNFFIEGYIVRVTGSLTESVNLKMQRLDPVCFENSETLDLINKSYFSIKFIWGFVGTIMDVLNFYLPYFLFMGIYLFTLKPILGIAPFIVFIPVLLTQIIRSKVFDKLEDDSVIFRRQSKYYEQCMVGREYLKETRILGANSYFIKLFSEALKSMNALKWKADLKVNLIELSMKMISLLGYLLILLMLFDAVLNKEISIGAFGAVFVSVDTMFNTMENLICERLGDYAKHFGKIKNYFRFLELPERIVDTKGTQEGTYGDIVLKNVTFSYPNCESNAVEDINLEIRKGETIALVGENGSGKSTLVRLITGLYLPTKGEVLHNGDSTHEISPKVLFDSISGVFQKYQRYQLTLEQNITISEMETCNATSKRVDEALSLAGVDISERSFPQGVKTLLSKEFNGVDLSGGQWQRVSIGRGFYREHEIIVLDEPTAAIDPVEESRIYESFGEIAKEKTSILVTHRLGSVKFANRIVVMKEGRIISIGTHEKLLEKCGYYKEMWESQAQHYLSC